LADALLGVVSNPDEPEELRARAAVSFGAALEQADLEELETGEFGDFAEVPITLGTFRRIQRELHRIYQDESVPKIVRRRILEGSVRAPADWHADAIRRAYSSGDREWMLTAVFAMRYVRGFDAQILEALKSSDSDIRCEAVSAAGNWELSAASPAVLALVNDGATPKPLLLAAIDAIASIRPKDARDNLGQLKKSGDEEIAEAADEAIALAAAAGDDEGDWDDDDEEDPGPWLN
jgi:hypothetical protein